MNVKDIHQKKFKTKMNGYACAEVDAYLDELCQHLEKIQAQNDDLSSRLKAANQELAYLKGLETTLRDTLVNAQKSANQILEEARERAGHIVDDANEQAEKIVEQAKIDCQQAKEDRAQIQQCIREYQKQVRQAMGEQLDAMEKYFHLDESEE